MPAIQPTHATISIIPPTATTTNRMPSTKRRHREQTHGREEQQRRPWLEAAWRRLVGEQRLDGLFELAAYRGGGVEAGLLIVRLHRLGAGLGAAIEEQRVDERHLLPFERPPIGLQAQGHRRPAGVLDDVALEFAFADHARDQRHDFGFADQPVPRRADHLRRVPQDVLTQPRFVDAVGRDRCEPAVSLLADEEPRDREPGDSKERGGGDR